MIWRHFALEKKLLFSFRAGDLIAHLLDGFDCLFERFGRDTTRPLRVISFSLQGQGQIRHDRRMQMGREISRIVSRGARFDVVAL